MHKLMSLIVLIAVAVKLAWHYYSFILFIFPCFCLEVDITTEQKIRSFFRYSIVRKHHLVIFVISHLLDWIRKCTLVLAFITIRALGTQLLGTSLWESWFGKRRLRACWGLIILRAPLFNGFKKSLCVLRYLFIGWAWQSRLKWYVLTSSYSFIHVWLFSICVYRKILSLRRSIWGFWSLSILLYKSLIISWDWCEIVIGLLDDPLEDFFEHTNLDGLSSALKFII